MHLFGWWGGKIFLPRPLATLGECGEGVPFFPLGSLAVLDILFPASVSGGFIFLPQPAKDVLFPYHNTDRRNQNYSSLMTLGCKLKVRLISLKSLIVSLLWEPVCSRGDHKDVNGKLTTQTIAVGPFFKVSISALKYEGAEDSSWLHMLIPVCMCVRASACVHFMLLISIENSRQNLLPFPFTTSHQMEKIRLVLKRDWQ